MEKMMKELTDVLKFYGLADENIETFESIMYDQIVENATEIREYLEMF